MFASKWKAIQHKKIFVVTGVENFQRQILEGLLTRKPETMGFLQNFLWKLNENSVLRLQGTDASEKDI